MILPKHIGIIMDGNGRWAKLRARPRTFGHIKGARVAKKIISAAAEMGIENLTLYAFSTENWMRPKSEVVFLMDLLQRYLERETDTLVKENIKFGVIGDLALVPTEAVKAIQYAIKATENNNGMNLIFALSYGSRKEIVDSAKALARKVRDGLLDPDKIDEHLFSAHLSTYPLPDPDLIIRTSGEQRLSNFLMWQAAYSELEFSQTLWPDFDRTEFEQILSSYSKRERRFGKVAAVDEHAVY